MSQPPNLPSVEQLLEPGGAVARLLPGFEPRPQQREMAEAVRRALRRRKLAVIEAGTGTGKSFGYLFAVVLHALETDTAAVVSSSTHVLQDQLIAKDIPFVQRVLAEYDLEFEAAEVKGMGAYLCRLALAENTRSLLTEFPESLARLDEWAATAVEGTRSEAPAVPAELWESVRADRDTCTRDKCAFYDTCFFYNARRRIARSQLLVANHSLLFADLAVKEEGGRVLPNYSVLVLDEAQNVEDAATGFLGSSIGPRGLKMLLHRLYNMKGQGVLPQIERVLPDMKNVPARERSVLPDYLRNQVYPEIENAEELVSGTFQTIEQAWRTLAPEAGGAKFGEGRPSLKPLRITRQVREHPALVDSQAAAHHLAALLELVANRASQVMRRLEPAEDLFSNRDFVTLGSTCKSLRERAQDIKDFFDPISGVTDTVKWLQPNPSRKGGSQMTLETAPLDVAPLLEQRLFKKLDTCVLTSATLSVSAQARLGSAGAQAGDNGPEFDYIRAKLGLAGDVAPRAETLRLDSPFDYRRNVLIGVPDDLPDPSAADFVREAARFLWRAFKVSRGRSLVLFHSWYTLRSTYDLLAPHAEKLGFRLLCQGEPGLSKNQLIEVFRRDIHSVLLATTSYREGIDVPGEALSNLILHRLPFPVPDEPVPQARMERIVENGGNSFEDYELPEAVIACKQAFGRLIRSHSDFGIFLCLDRRLVTRRYGARFLGALPPCEIVRGKKEKVLARAAAFLNRSE